MLHCQHWRQPVPQPGGRRIGPGCAEAVEVDPFFCCTGANGAEALVVPQCYGSVG